MSYWDVRQKVLLNGQEVPMTEEENKKSCSTIQIWPKQALRVLGMAYKYVDAVPENLGIRNRRK